MSPSQIMVVEDEPIVAMDIERALRSFRYSVLPVATSGKEAVQRAGEARPDLVLMDIRLKGDMDGVEAAAQIRERFNIPVIYLTANADDRTVQRAKGTGPFGYMLKPFEKEELYTAVEVALYRHHMDKKLKEREQWLTAVLQSTGDAVVVTDEKGFVMFLNPEAEALIKSTSEEARGKEWSELFKIMDELTVSPPPDVVKVIREGRAAGLDNHTMLVLRDGLQIPIAGSVAAMRDDKQNPVGMVMAFHDITDRKRLELQLQQSNEILEERIQERTRELVHSEKLAAMGRMAAGLAHEFSTPLSVIRGYAELALKKIARGDVLASPLEMILKQSLRLSDMVQTLLTFSRKGKESARQFNLNDAVRAAILLVEAQSRVKMVEIKQELNPYPMEALGHPDQIEQVIINLADNAFDAMSQGGILAIKTQKVVRSGQASAQIELTDTGTGISPEIRDKIFEPFFTTKAEEKGTGLGLWIIREIVTRHGGDIQCSSRKGEGTTFTVVLPLV